ncbi:hypothetical protein AWW68_18885 [Roseivirga spongicola]|uniref:Uncharacterized protein n=1 Tax=Roseivirga spongicola TaxID=333140 RepID=A0A150XE21_9BACT|nr:hypothetical protein [Roseivirga spongicola]KYG76924.1 hypothetical protein AWW68_18885 [Roseivirga spongicola]
MLYTNPKFINASVEMKLFIHYLMEHCSKVGLWTKEHEEYPVKTGINPKQLKGLQEQLGEEIILDFGSHLLLPFFMEYNQHRKNVSLSKTALKELNTVCPQWWKEQLASGRYILSDQDLEKRKEAFRKKIIGVMKEYEEEKAQGKREWVPTAEDANLFFKHWSTVADNGHLMKCELKQFKPWNTKGRFGAWMRRKNEWSKK